MLIGQQNEFSIMSLWSRGRAPGNRRASISAATRRSPSISWRSAALPRLFRRARTGMISVSRLGRLSWSYSVHRMPRAANCTGRGLSVGKGFSRLLDTHLRCTVDWMWSKDMSHLRPVHATNLRAAPSLPASLVDFGAAPKRAVTRSSKFDTRLSSCLRTSRGRSDVTKRIQCEQLQHITDGRFVGDSTEHLVTLSKKLL